MIELRAGSAALTIDPGRGARWSSLRVDGTELLVGPPDDDDRSIYWGCFLMAPWAGRIEGAALDWSGERLRLPRNEGGHSIHGVVFDRPWRIESASATGAALSCPLDPGRWPPGGRAWQRIRLSGAGLTAEAEVVAGDTAMPAALGWHPWFPARDGGACVTLAADRVLETDALIPTGRLCPVDALTDLRGGATLTGRALDHAYPGAASPAVVRWRDLELSIAFGGPLRTVVVHSRPGSFCVEPQTAWPNAPALASRGVAGTGLVRLVPEGRLAASMRWSWRRIAPGTDDPAGGGAGVPLKG